MPFDNITITEKQVDALLVPKAQDLQSVNGRMALGERIGGRIIRSMQGMRATTEHVALTIGELLIQIVETATHDNDSVRQTLQGVIGGSHDTKDGKTPITQVIRNQSKSVSVWVSETRQFFKQQMAFAQAASGACDEINSCAESVSELMRKSHLLALNMQIESARLGDRGRAFSVIGEEMKCFAIEVRQANETIKGALEALSAAMPSIQKETVKMDGRVTVFSEQFELQSAEVERQTQTLADSLQSTLDQAEHRNNKILKCSQATLSELQFQDPMAQSLQRAEYDVGKLLELIAEGQCEDVSLAHIDPVVGEDGTQERESGSVDLF